MWSYDHVVGIFGRNIDRAYTKRSVASPTLAIASPWNPQDALISWAIDDALSGILDRNVLPMTPEVAIRVPGIARAHGIICTQLAEIPFFQMNGKTPTADQPEWLTNSRSGVAPYHRMYGAASDWFWHGWACFGFTADMTDCFHVPYGLWEMDDDGLVVLVDDQVPEQFRAKLIAVPLGYRENGLLINGTDTIRQARNVEAAYQQRLDNPIPLTVLTIDDALWEQWTPEERAQFRDQWNEGRRKNSTAMKPASVTVDMPGQVQVDLYETGRNGVRIDIANHTGLPASALEGVRQGGGGGGTEMRYTGVSGGAARSELWDFGLAKRMLLAFEARMSLDDVVPSGLSIRGDLTAAQSIPAPNTNPTSED